jgi:iron(III) transport system substrate-binding protein
VAIVFPDRAPDGKHPRLGVLYIPNTVALVKGGPYPAGGMKLIVYRLRPETVTWLAEGGGFQIPLNPSVKAKLPPAVATPDQVNRMAVDWEMAADLWDETQAFLRDEFAR